MSTTLAARAARDRDAGKPPTDTPPTTPPGEQCTIRWWRGYVNSDFYAVRSTDEEGLDVVATSPPFRWSKAADPPQGGKAAAAHDALVESLLADGWEPHGAPATWYGWEFRRASTRPPADGDDPQLGDADV